MNAKLAYGALAVFTCGMIALAVVKHQSPGDICFEKVRGDLKDPETATLVSYTDYMTGTLVVIRAANSYGAFARIYGACNNADVNKLFEHEGDARSAALNLR